MAIKGYFYNALKTGDTYDRLYNDEDFCRYLNKIIGNGVFPTPSTNFNVTTNNNMTVSVAVGEAWILGHKLTNDAIETLSIDSADPIFDRIDRVVVYSDSDTLRAGGLRIIKGTAGSSPVAPALTRTDDIYELCLAEIYIPKGATAISASNITDTRPNSDLCGWVAGLIQQIDVTSLYNQYLAMYSGLYSTMETWQENMQAQFDNWFYDLTANLNVGAYIRQFHKVVNGGDTVSNVIPLDMDGYAYESNDVFIANLNGLALTRNVDYTFAISAGVPTITLDGNMNEGETFEITVLKSSLAKTENSVLKRATGTKFVHCEECMPETVRRFSVDYTGDDNIIVVTNRNLINFDKFEDSTTISGLTFTKDDNSIVVTGTAIEDGSIEIEMDKNAFQNGNTYIMSNNGTSLMEHILSLEYSDADAESYSIAYDPGGTTTIAIEHEVTKATFSIHWSSGWDIEESETLKPQIECGLYFTEYVPGNRSTFTYDNGATLPVFTDYINNIYSTDDNISGINVVYVLVSQPIPRELELMYYWDYTDNDTGSNKKASLGWTDKIKGVNHSIYAPDLDWLWPYIAANKTGLYFRRANASLYFTDVFNIGRIVEIEFGDTNFSAAGGTARCVAFAYGDNFRSRGFTFDDKGGLCWDQVLMRWVWGDIHDTGTTDAIVFENASDPDMFRNGKLKVHWVSTDYFDIYVNDVFFARVPKNVGWDYSGSTIDFGYYDYYADTELRTFATCTIKTIKIYG